jgi:uncharacterized protein YjbI with pentapeptide repeats
MSCQFFSSGAWNEQLQRRLRATVHLGAFLRMWDDVPNVHTVLTDLRESNPDLAENLYQADIKQVIEEAQIKYFADLDMESVLDIWKSWRQTHDLRPLPDSCPHDEHGDERCVFHTPEYDMSPDEFHQHLTDPTRPNQFVGARFEDLQFPATRLSPEGGPIDLRFATITGTLDLRDTEVTATLFLSNSTIDRIQCNKATFERDFEFKRGKVEQELVFDRAEFERDAVFLDTCVHAPASFERAKFRDYANFKRTEFTAEVNFERAEFYDANFFDSNVASLDFSYVSIDRKGFFMRTEFEGYCDFRQLSAEKYVDFTRTEFRGAVNFSESVFKSDLLCYEATFGSKARFDAVETQGTLVIEETVFSDETSFKEAQINTCAFDCQFTGEGVLDFSESRIEKGRIHLPATNPPMYDFRAATIGDITFTSETADIFDHLDIVQTDFEGFDFSKYKDTFRENWKLHRSGQAYAPGTLEATYLKAKNGANQIGDNNAAAEFFIKEMKYRRRGYRDEIINPGNNPVTRLFSLGKWFINWFFNLSCGYGERPFRAVTSSLFTVFMFGVLYAAADVDLRTTEQLLSYVVFSLQIFVTLIFGTIPDFQSETIRFLSSLEAFMGAFLIALFVFSLTRSVNR